MTRTAYRDESLFVLQGDVIETLGKLRAESVQTCVTSPPYWGLRDYGTAGQLGLEATPDEYVRNLVNVFREVRRVLREDGTLWLNLGDTYASGTKGSGGGRANDPTNFTGKAQKFSALKVDCGVPDKNLLGVPWRVAFALQADGWFIRSEIIWHKPNAQPSTVTDRPIRDHEQLFLLTRNARYYYDIEAVKEDGITGRRHRRTVWTVQTKPYRNAHFAVFPPALIEPCILAGAPEGGTVLDPFAGSGTTLMVARQHNRRAIGIELNPDYIPLILERCGVSARPAVPQAAISA
jgi:DNA modification methylase